MGGGEKATVGGSVNLAHRVEEPPAYLFAEISKKIAEKRAQGIDVISFGIGDPDLEGQARRWNCSKASGGSWTLCDQRFSSLTSTK